MTISRPEERQLPSTIVKKGEKDGDAQFAVSRLLAKDKRGSALYYYWFFSGQETYRDESLALLYVLHETIFQGRSDGGIVEISADITEPAISPEKQEEAEKTVRDFTSVFVPALEKLLADAAAKDADEKPAHD